MLFLSSRQNAELNPYRDWALAELAPFDQFLDVWRFEDQPASPYSPEARYISGVDASRLVLFIAGDV
jgi:hypothetical protein